MKRVEDASDGRGAEPCEERVGSTIDKDGETNTQTMGDAPADTRGWRAVGARTYRAARRIVVTVVGTTLLLLGVVLVFTPGPAIVVWSLGLAVLAIEFVWARRWLRRLRETAGDAVRRVRGESVGEADTGDSDRSGPG